jgi:hypothetical protein
MESFQHVSNIFQTIETLPREFVDKFHEKMEQKVEQLLETVQEFIKCSLSDIICVEDFSKNQFQDLLKCMVLFNEESINEESKTSNEESNGQYYLPIRRSLRGEDDHGGCVLEALCRDTPWDEYRRLKMLKHLRRLKLFHKNDITEMQLLRESFRASQSIFHYLVDWDPTALLTLDKNRLTLLQELIEWCYSPKLIRRILEAGLKYLPYELGLLLFTAEGNESPYALLMDKNRIGLTNGEEAGWTIIEQCLEEVADLKLPEPDPTTNLYPFMVAACDQSCPCVDLVYYLLRKDPSVMLQFNRSNNDERGLEEGTSRKRKMMQ